MVIAIPETKANLTCIYKRHKATPICNGKLKQSSNQSDSKNYYKRSTHKPAQSLDSKKQAEC